MQKSYQASTERVFPFPEPRAARLTGLMGMERVWNYFQRLEEARWEGLQEATGFALRNHCCLTDCYCEEIYVIMSCIGSVQ